MKKLLIVTSIFPPDIGGPASYASLLAGRLSSDRSIDVVTYSSKWTSDMDRDVKYGIRRIWLGWPRILRHSLFAFSVLNKARKADMILALSPMNAGIMAKLASRLWRKPYMVKIVGDWAWEYSANKRLTPLLLSDFQVSKKRGRVKLFDAIQKWVTRDAMRIIVPSNFLADIVRGWGVEDAKIIVVFNGVEVKISGNTQEEARKEIGIHGNIILSVGRLVPWKGFKLLVKIMPRILEISPFFRLVIVGTGPERDILNKIVQNLNLAGKVYLVGAKSKQEIATYMAAAEMMVLNTGYEGFSHLILEALAYQVPVVTTNVGGNGEIITQGVNGFMVKYNDEFNLLEAIKTVHGDKDLRRSFRENGLKTVEKFSSQKMIEKTMNVLNYE